jgi:hypothetical protein
MLLQRVQGLGFCLLLSMAPLAAQAMLAGAAPDSPAARVDANTKDSPWAGVVVVRTSGVFSGVAVSPRHILTAAHVAGGAKDNPASVTIVLNYGADESHSLAVTKADVFPTNSFPYDDLVLLTLAEPLPEGVPIYPINDLPPEPGKTGLILVGYGASGNGDAGASVGGSASVKRVGENMLDGLTASVDQSGRRSSFYLYDFDGPEGNSQMGGPTLGNTRETMVGSGDSGSPAFSLIKGYRALTGINTFATPLNSGKALNFSFGQGGGGMLLADPRFLQWLDEMSGGAVKRVSTLPELGAAWHWWLGGGVALSGLAGFVGWRQFRS